MPTPQFGLPFVDDLQPLEPLDDDLDDDLKPLDDDLEPPDDDLDDDLEPPGDLRPLGPPDCLLPCHPEPPVVL